MSEPTRYTGKTELSILGSPHWEHPKGEWVKWEDYARLKADVRNCYTAIRVKDEEKARLQAELDRVTSQNGYAYTGLAVSMLRDELAQRSHDNFEIRKAHKASIQMVRDLQSEVERLEKKEEYLQNTLNQYALDDMRLQAEVERLRKANDSLAGVIDQLNAAKEGKQS